MPSEIPHLDERFKPKGIRGVDRTEESSFTGIFRDWAVEDFVFCTGTDKGVYLRAFHAQREPFSFSGDCGGVLAETTDQLPVDDLCAPCRWRINPLPA